MDIIYFPLESVFHAMKRLYSVFSWRGKMFISWKDTRSTEKAKTLIFHQHIIDTNEKSVIFCTGNCNDIVDDVIYCSIHRKFPKYSRNSVANVSEFLEHLEELFYLQDLVIRVIRTMNTSS